MASPIASFPMFLNELQGRFIHCKPSKYRYLSQVLQHLNSVQDVIAKTKKMVKQSE